MKQNFAFLHVQTLTVGFNRLPRVHCNKLDVENNS